MNAETSTEVTDNEASSRYELTVDGRTVAFADYRVTGNSVVMPHTVVDPSMRGRGLAAVLVGHALDEIRAQGRSVVPQCWYVAQFIDQHPEYADLVAPTRHDAGEARHDARQADGGV